MLRCGNPVVFRLFRNRHKNSNTEHVYFTHHCFVFRIRQNGHLRAVQKCNFVPYSSWWINVKWKEKTLQIYWRCRDHQNCWWRTKEGSWIKRHQLDAICFFISLFNAKHFSDVNTSILRSLRLICWVI